MNGSLIVTDYSSFRMSKLKVTKGRDPRTRPFYTNLESFTNKSSELIPCLRVRKKKKEKRWLKTWSIDNRTSDLPTQVLRLPSQDRIKINTMSDYFICKGGTTRKNKCTQVNRNMDECSTRSL